MRTHCKFQRHNGGHLRREKRKVRIFGKGKCNKLIANFSATMVTSLSSLSLSLSLSLFLSHRAHLTHNMRRFRASYNMNSFNVLKPLQKWELNARRAIWRSFSSCGKGLCSFFASSSCQLLSLSEKKRNAFRLIEWSWQEWTFDLSFPTCLPQ